MDDMATIARAPDRVDPTLFTIVGGTTIAERATIVRDNCREGSHVELRRPNAVTEDSTRIDVWLECKSVMGLVKTWKLIGHVPVDAAAMLLPAADANSTVVAYGKVKAVYAPAGRDEAVVTVQISPVRRFLPEMPNS